MSEEHHHHGTPHEDESVEVGSERVEAFSDAVMAVIITIMAFQLRAPQGVSLDAVGRVAPGLVVYVLSFAFIGIYWNNHHHLMRAAVRINAGVMWANLFLLFWLSLVPVVTEWVRNLYQLSLPAAAYGVVSLAAGFAYRLLISSLIKANGPDSAVAKAIGSDLKGYLSLGLYSAGIVLAFVSPYIAYALYISVAVAWVIPDRRFAGR